MTENPKCAARDALERLVEHIELNGGCHRGCPEHDDARAALASPCVSAVDQEQAKEARRLVAEHHERREDMASEWWPCLTEGDWAGIADELAYHLKAALALLDRDEEEER